MVLVVKPQNAAITLPAYARFAGNNRDDGDYRRSRHKDDRLRKNPTVRAYADHEMLHGACCAALPRALYRSCEWRNMAGSLRSDTVLVVEDDTDVADLVWEVLGESYSVECACDAGEAISRIETRSPNLVLSDCCLPAGGLDQLLARADAAGSAVILMSGCAETLERFAGHGRPVLQKPFKIVDLLGSVGGALDYS